MNLHLRHVKDDTKLQIAASVLGSHAFDWFHVFSQVESIPNLETLKRKLHARFQSINKVKIARDKLTTWK